MFEESCVGPEEVGTMDVLLAAVHRGLGAIVRYSSAVSEYVGSGAGCSHFGLRL